MNGDFQDRGEALRQQYGIDGTAGDAQDVDHQYADDGETGACLVCGLAKTYRKHLKRPVPQFMCLVCMYLRPRPGLDEDALGELTVFTVARGQMLCMRHVPCAQETVHRTIASGVHLESNGTIESLSEYQNWRAAQDAP